MQTNSENIPIKIKNVVLYDPWQYVSGFAELRTANGTTTIKVRHNLAQSATQSKNPYLDNPLSGDNLLMSLTYNGKTFTFELSRNQVFSLADELDLDKEILICIMQKEANQITTLASGILNHNPAHSAAQSKKPNLDNPYPAQSAAQSKKPNFNNQIPKQEIPPLNGKAVLLNKSNLDFPQSEITDVPESDEANDLTVKPAQLDDIINETSKNGISRETAGPHDSAVKSKNHNLDNQDEDSQYKTKVAREIDQLLRQVCKVDDQNRGICETCPYRDHFYGDGV